MFLGINDYDGKAVLITGGTRGIGLATGLAFARLGAHCILTYKWGEDDLNECKQQFISKGYREPLLVQSDVADVEDIKELLVEIKKYHEDIEVFISNVGFGLLTKDFQDYSEQGLFKTIEYSVWPMVNITKQIKETFNSYPRYVMGLSSNGPDTYHTNYDFVATSKALMETLVRYINYRFKNTDMVVNVLRVSFVKTNSLKATCGEEFESYGEHYGIPNLFIKTEEVADAILALCSGLMDGVRGQVVNIDKGYKFADNIMTHYEKSFELKVKSTT